MNASTRKISVQPQGDFRLYLQQELLRRCEKNPRYSLRAYAQQLDIHHGSLSQLLAGKRKITGKVIAKLAPRLGLSPQEANRYLTVTKAKKRIAPAPLNTTTSFTYHELTQDMFVTVSEWYHDALLEMTHLRGFNPEPRRLARALGITVSEVKMAIERLQRLELLRIENDGRWVDTLRDNTTELDLNFSSAAMRKYQKKMLAMSVEALETIDRKERDHSSAMLAVKRADLPVVKEKIREFRAALSQYVQRDEKPADTLYTLAISFFPFLKEDFSTKENKK